MSDEVWVIPDVKRYEPTCWGSHGMSERADGDYVMYEDFVETVIAFSQALRAAESLAACCMAVDGYSRAELYEIAETMTVEWRQLLGVGGGDEDA